MLSTLQSLVKVACFFNIRRATKHATKHASTAVLKRSVQCGWGIANNQQQDGVQEYAMTLLDTSLIKPTNIQHKPFNNKVLLPLQ